MKPIHKLLPSILLFTHALYSEPANLSPHSEREVKVILSAFAAQDKPRIAKLIAYPLHRPYPIPPIKNETEMLARFDQVFDQTLLTEIRASTVRNWSDVGWRGTMLNQGTLWMTGGKIFVINYSSKIEASLWKDLVERERASLHPSIRAYTAPELLVETKQFLVRIDVTEKTFRYSSWPLGASQSEKPSLVINGGTLAIEATIRRRIYTFKNGSFIYTLGDDRLAIEQDGKVILQQEIVKRVEPF